MKGVFLDADSMGLHDLNLTPLHNVLDHWDFYGESDESQIPGRIADAALVLVNKVRLSADTLARAKQLKLICISATGTDNVDLVAAARLGITVTNVRGYATAAVIQHVYSLLFALSGNLIAYDQAVRAGTWAKSSHFALLDYPIVELAGKVMGIVGYGELGQAVATRAKAFGMAVQVAVRPGSGETEGRVSLDELLSVVDVLTLHCPLTPETRGLIDATALKKMKKSAILINTARGGIVDELALADALRNGELGGAGVDVLSEEPPTMGNPLLASDVPNIIVTPHIAWAAQASRQRLVNEVADNISYFCAGKPRNIVT